MAASVQSLELVGTPALNNGSLVSECGMESGDVTSTDAKKEIVVKTENELGPSDVEQNEQEQNEQEQSSRVSFDQVYNLSDLAVELNTEEKAVNFCRAWGLLPKSASCPNCSRQLTKYNAARQASVTKPFRYRFICSRKSCKQSGKNKVEMTKSTFLEGGHISYRKAILLIYLFSQKSTLENAVFETSGRSFNNQTTSLGTVNDLFSSCRQVCLESINRKHGTCYNKIGGLKCTVEINAVRFGKSHSVVCGKKVEVEGRWAIGGICRETGDCFFLPAEGTEDDLIRIVVDRVERETTIVSDYFTPRRLEGEGFHHLTVDENHVDLAGRSTQLIESTWQAVKQDIPKSVRNHNLAAYLAEYMWRKQHKDKGHHFVRLLEDIARIYPGPNV